MRIILHPAFVSARYIPGSSRFLLDLLIEMARRHPGDSFVILSNGSARHLPQLPPNMKVELVKTGAWAWLGWPLWNRLRLSGMIKKLRTDILITNEAKAALTSAAPVCFIELKTRNQSRQLNETKQGLYSKKTLKRLSRASGIVLFSSENKALLATHIPGSGEKIHVISPGPIELVQPMKWVDKENVKVQYTGGKEYFVYAGDLDEGSNLHTLLKAFSRFKKRQLSNMQLVLAGNSSSSTAAFSEKLGSFKYRTDVHLLADPPKQVLLDIIAAAYAFVSPGAMEGFPLNMIRAVCAGVPVIAFEASKNKREAAGIVYTPEDSEQGFADTMQLIYKDEDMRAAVIREGQNQLASVKTNDMVEAFRQVLLETLQTNHSNFTTI
jgi:glycosyltransferase involved in cell wall biosynthesis